MFTLIVQVVINELRCMTPKRFPVLIFVVKRAYQSSFLISIQVNSIILSDITEKKLHLSIAQRRFLSECSTIYPCWDYLCGCVRTLLQSRFFCLFVSSFKFLFLLLLCFLTGLDHQGIFRLSGSTTEINDMKQLFENGNKTERCMLLLCHVHLTRKALTFTQTTCIYMKTFNPLVTASEWRKKPHFSAMYLILGLFSVH